MKLFTGNIKGAKKILGHRMGHSKGSKLEEGVFILFFIVSVMFVVF